MALRKPPAMPASIGLTEEASTRTSSWSGPTSGVGWSSRSPGGASKLSRVKARPDLLAFLEA
jgi:hypothetical protein